MRQLVFILFIGNSLTSANDLPGLFCDLARQSGHNAVCQSVTFNNFSLADHLQDGTAARRIGERKWDVVVLQQGPSAMESSRRELLRSSAHFAELIRESGARPALYSVWPSRNRSFDFPRVADSYRQAARATNALYFPVGNAWELTRKRDRSIELYSEDGFHPTPAGTQLAALVMHRIIFGGVPGNTAGALRDAALQAR